MRNVRRMEYAFLFILVILDLIVQSFWVQLSAPVEFVSQLSFMGLIVSIRNDTMREYIPRFVFLAVIMGLFHLNSYPIYVLSIGFSLAVIRIWYRHIGSSFIEWLVIIGLALFIKELIVYLSLIVFQNYMGSFMFFMAKRGVWVILINLVLFRLVMMVRNFCTGILLKRTQRNYQ